MPRVAVTALTDAKVRALRPGEINYEVRDGLARGLALMMSVLGEGLVEDRVRKAGAALSRVLGFEFRSHDLRRTAATRMAAAGVPREHIAHVLNHV